MGSKLRKINKNVKALNTAIEYLKTQLGVLNLDNPTSDANVVESEEAAKTTAIALEKQRSDFKEAQRKNRNRRKAKKHLTTK